MISISKVTGAIGVSSMQCINPIASRWAVRWGIKIADEETSANYMEAIFDHKPSIDEVRLLVLSWYNKQINDRILSGFSWRGMAVWLSSENQFNYKVAQDIAVQTSGASLPVTFKFGTDEEPIYHRFESVEDISEFYMLSLAHINGVLEEGWKQKDSINWEVYK